MIVGEDGVLVMDAQATPVQAQKLIDRIRTVTEQADQVSGSEPLSRGPGDGGVGLRRGSHHRQPGNL